MQQWNILANQSTFSRFICECLTMQFNTIDWITLSKAVLMSDLFVWGGFCVNWDGKVENSD